VNATTAADLPEHALCSPNCLRRRDVADAGWEPGTVCAACPPPPRRFRLMRHTDISGVSGTGLVAHGVQFPDGSVVTRWNGVIAQTSVWASLEEVVAIHGHDGATEVEWLDPGA
jgi:hypothetical protein